MEAGARHVERQSRDNKLNADVPETLCGKISEGASGIENEVGPSR